MFTGIVRALGTVKTIREGGAGRTLVINLSGLGGLGGLNADSNSIRTGDSIAVNGACLTVTELRAADAASAASATFATFAISPETLARCLIGEWAAGDRLNLEPALTLQTPLGGHLVSGHIDGVGTLLARHESGAFTRMELETTRAVGCLIAAKGAIAVDGVSLTVNTVSDHADHTRFEVMLVPHTLENTTLGTLQPGARAHLEVDSVARYVRRLLESEAANK